MDKFEKYSKKHIHFYTGEIRPLIEEYIKHSNVKSYLDAGCGDGSLLYALKEKDLLKGKKVFAIDLSPDRVARASAIDSTFLCSVDNAESLSTISNSSIDFLTLVNVIEHGDDMAISKSLSRVIKNQGYCYISTTFKKSWGWYFYRNNGKWVLDPTHVREYTKEDILFNILRNNKFEIITDKKTIATFPIAELLLRKLGFSNSAFSSSILRKLRKLSIKIPGYYKWEIVCQKHEI